MTQLRTTDRPRPPPEFRLDRNAESGPHRLLDVFPGLDRLPGFTGLTRSAALRRRLAGGTRVEVVPGSVFMYIAPHEIPPLLRRVGFLPYTAPDDCVVVGRSHLRRSSRMTLYMDILHELCHILQRWRGVDLWREGYRYADRPTEIEAYRYVIGLAREMGASEAFLRNYLHVGWIAPKEYRLLLRNVGVAPR